MKTSYDVVVVGARCAGAATAMLASRLGLRVLAVDQAAYGSDALSTHALMRGAVTQLQRWGLLSGLRAGGTPPVKATSFFYGDEVITIPIRARGRVDALYAPRRDLLDATLVNAAVRAGADVYHRVRVERLLWDRGRVSGIVARDRTGEIHEVRARVVVGADGNDSAVARMVSAPKTRVAQHCTANIFGYFSNLGIDEFQWYYGHGVAGGAIPTNDGLTCVFTSLSPERYRALEGRYFEGYLEALAEMQPELARRVGVQKPVRGLRRFAGVPGFLRKCVGPGWALVGDAGYFKDPQTAHGITDAFRDAELLATALAEEREPALRGYEETRDQLSGRFFEITDEVASLTWNHERLKVLHYQLAEEMKHEVRWLGNLDAAIAA